MPQGDDITQPAPTKQVAYKNLGDDSLHLDVFEPQGHSADDSRPGIVFFFGGGWKGGSPNQFYPHCGYLASRGMWAASAQYRTERSHGTDPRACVRDGKSAVRYIRSHAAELGVNPNMFAAGGGSAGGHVAATTATVEGFNEQGEDTSVSCVPDALVLFNPVYDNGPDGYGHDRVKEYWQQFSPMHNIHAGMPPAVVFLGTQDRLIPVATAEKFKAGMEKAGVRSDLHIYEGQGHGFFNLKHGEQGRYRQTVYEADRFLASLGFIEGEPTISG